MRVLGLGAALVGGICLVANRFVDVDPLSWLGSALLAVAVLVAGAGLARAWWLTVVTGLGAVALAWALLEVAYDAAADRDVEAVAGGLATLCVAVAVLRPARPAPGSGARSGAGPTPPRGNHRS